MTGQSNIRLLEAALFEAVSGELAGFGFESKVKQQALVRKNVGCTWIIHIGFVRHRDDVDATIDLGVEIAPVDKLFSATEATHWGAATIGAELGNLVDRRPRRWTIESVARAPQIAQQMRTEVEKFGIDWLGRFSQLETIYQTLVRNDAQSRLIMPLQAKRCAILLGLATLLRTKEEARQVFLESHALLSSRQEPMLQQFENYAAKLLEK
jgi:hypothetical protein